MIGIFMIQKKNIVRRRIWISTTFNQRQSSFNETEIKYVKKIKSFFLYKKGNE